MFANHPAIRCVLVSAMLAAVACGLALLITESVIANDMESWTYDFLVNHGGYAYSGDEIVVVDVDNKSIQKIGRFPMPRDLLATIINRVADEKPKVIGLDFFLTEERNAAEDAALNKALTNAGNVIVASQLGAGGLPSLEPLLKFCQREDSSSRGFCKENTAGALGFAFVNMPIDNDGYVRSMMLLPYDPNDPVSFPLMIAQQYSGNTIQPAGHDAAKFLGRRIWYSDAERHTAFITWNLRPTEHLSALDILQGKLDAKKAFAGKIVLVGQSSDAARDRFFTPLFRPRSDDGSRLMLPGIDLLAAAVETLLQGPVVSVLSPGMTWGLGFLIVLVAAWTTVRVPVRYAFILVVAMMLVVYGGAQVLFTAKHVWLKIVGTEVALLFVLPLSFTYQFVQERFGRSLAEAERKQMMQVFGRYVSSEVAQQIWARRSEIVMAGEERVATVLFSDIRSFTALSAGKPSKHVLKWLNRYFAAMDEVISQEGGFLNKFIGDGLMVLFGVPLSRGAEDDASAAVRCALAMLERVEQLNADPQPDAGWPPVKIGVGIHSGPVTCGNVGSAHRLEYSVIGETVNLASRLESMTKELGTPIVISADTEEAIRGCGYRLRNLGAHKVRGLEEPISLYAVEPCPPDEPARFSATARVRS